MSPYWPPRSLASTPRESRGSLTVAQNLSVPFGAELRREALGEQVVAVVLRQPRLSSSNSSFDRSLGFLARAASLSASRSAVAAESRSVYETFANPYAVRVHDGLQRVGGRRVTGGGVLKDRLDVVSQSIDVRLAVRSGSEPGLEERSGCTFIVTVNESPFPSRSGCAP